MTTAEVSDNGYGQMSEHSYLLPWNPWVNLRGELPQGLPEPPGRRVPEEDQEHQSRDAAGSAGQVLQLPSTCQHPAQPAEHSDCRGGYRVGGGRCVRCPPITRSFELECEVCSSLIFEMPLSGWCAGGQISDRPSGGARRGRAAVCESGSTPTLRRNCTEHQSGYLHGATRWTNAATATPLRLTHVNVKTNVNGTVFVCRISTC
ncbi:uncharacterized protein LOC128430634 [Pleuronectes platessa]|uniref:uncharacterized protein LOC128430634 n=1 Tax=Pleuronectes platessa TaxID=8262 RepID=UPI00232A4036|nr:uncharacterized protein LOC128430634 [Pleuronectes platessa]